MTDARRPDFSVTGLAPRLWLTPDRPTIEVPYFSSAVDANSSWLLVNSQMSTYARVLYDESNWNLLSRQLLLDHTVIPRATRVQLIDDAFTLAMMNLLDYRVAMDLMEYMTVVKDEFSIPTVFMYFNLLKNGKFGDQAFKISFLVISCYHMDR